MLLCHLLGILFFFHVSLILCEVKIHGRCLNLFTLSINFQFPFHLENGRKKSLLSFLQSITIIIILHYYFYYPSARDGFRALESRGFQRGHSRLSHEKNYLPLKLATLSDQKSFQLSIRSITYNNNNI